MFSVEQKSAGLFWATHGCDHSNASRNVPLRLAGNLRSAIFVEGSRRARVLLAQEPFGSESNPIPAVVVL